MDDVSFFFVGLDKNIPCTPKKKLSPTQARHWLGEVSRDSVKPMGKLLHFYGFGCFQK